MPSSARLFLLAACCALLAAALVIAQGGAAVHRQLLIVVDGLGPTTSRPEVMPNLTALGRARRGLQPASLRLSDRDTRERSSISTGAYPETHGLMGNSVFFPQVDPAKFLDTARSEALLKIARRRRTSAHGADARRNAAGRGPAGCSSSARGRAGRRSCYNPTGAGGAILHYAIRGAGRSSARSWRRSALPPGDDAPSGSSMRTPSTRS